MEQEELVYQGRFAGVMAPMSVSLGRRVVLACAILCASAGLAILANLVGLTEIEGVHSVGMAFLFVSAAVLSLMFVWASRLSPVAMGRHFPAVAVVAFTSVAFLLAIGTVIVGPAFGAVAVFYVHTPLLAFMVLRLRWAVIVTTVTCLGFAVGLRVVHSTTGLQSFLSVVLGAIAVAVLIGGIARGLEESRSLEHSARAELDRVNARLRRFLAPQVADVVTQEGAQLAPHRADIAVCFVDLRGFSNFTNAVDADTVVDVLTAYYAAVGSVVDRHDGTIGGFDGDGVFAYLGDPMPNPNAPADALAMARQIACALDELVLQWSVPGALLGYGIGLTFGQATVGLVGFENRFDYTPVGAVVNLAARLCADAKHGEIVIDDALRVATALDGAARPRGEVGLKGFGTVDTYAVAH